MVVVSGVVVRMGSEIVGDHRWEEVEVEIEVESVKVEEGELKEQEV